MRAIKRLYFARSEKKNIFPKKLGGDNKNERFDDSEKCDQNQENVQLKDEILNHSSIRVHMSDWLSLLLGLSRNEYLNSLYTQGLKRIS
jgi:hypothetical protein